jgi:general secretion pathway protein A
MYTNHYNFNKKPFNLTPDPNFLYLTDGHREALASMSYGVKERKGIITITGEVGTGKTTLIYTFLNSLNKNVNTVYIYHTNITFEQILKKILNELNIYSDQADKTSLLQCFNDYLIEKLANDEIVAIIIDEAQNLGDDVLEELRMLTNLETSKSKLLQLILVGQPELEKKLNSDNLRQLKQRISIRRQTVPLTYDQSEEYIKHRLRLAGSKSNIFNKNAISRICEHSKGIPRIINIICDNALLIGFAKSNKKINDHIINEVIKDMDNIFIIKPDNLTSDKIITENYQTSNSTNYYKAAVFVLFILLISVVFLINRNGFLKQNNPEPSDNKNISLSNNQNLTDTLATDVVLETNTAVASQINHLDNVNLTKNLSTKSNNISILDIRELQHKTITDRSANKNSTIKDVNVNLKSEPLNLIRTAKVKDGSTLFLLTLEYYNNISTTLAYIIIKANPNIKNIHFLMTDQEIVIPRVTLETPLIKTSDNRYNIELGTFESINKAKKFSKETMLSGNKIKIIPKKVSLKDTWYQVVLEKDATKKDCLSTVELLKEKGLLACFNDINFTNKVRIN